MGRGGARDQDAVAGPHGAAETGHVLPHGAGRDPCASVASASHRIRGREAGDVVTQIARRGQVGWAPVFVAAIPRDGIQVIGRPIQLRESIAVQRKVEESQVVLEVAPPARPGAHDHPGHAGLLEHVARAQVGDRNAQPVGDPPRSPQHLLKAVPSPCLVHEAAVLHLRPGQRVVDGWRRPVQPAVAQQPAGECPVGQQLHAVGPAHLGHGCGRAPVQQRVADLVADDGYAAVERHVQVHRVQIGRPQVQNLPLGLQVGQVEQAIQPARVGVVPGVELEQIDALHPNPPERAVDRRLHLGPRRRARGRHPLGEHAHPFPSAGQGPGDDLGGPVVIGGVEGVEPRLHMGLQRARRFIRVELGTVPFLVRDLPEPVQHAGHPQSRSQQPVLDAHSGGSSPKMRSTSAPEVVRAAISRQ